MTFTSSSIKMQPTKTITIRDQKYNMPTFTSTLYHIATNPNHQAHKDSVWNNASQRIYWMEGNTLYQRMTVYDKQRRNWLKSMGLEIGDDCALYQPVIRVENGIVTTWETHLANMGNKFLEIEKSHREINYPNLYFAPFDRDWEFLSSRS